MNDRGFGGWLGLHGSTARRLGRGRRSQRAFAFGVLCCVLVYSSMQAAGTNSPPSARAAVAGDSVAAPRTNVPPRSFIPAPLRRAQRSAGAVPVLHATAPVPVVPLRAPEVLPTPPACTLVHGVMQYDVPTVPGSKAVRPPCSYAGVHFAGEPAAGGDTSAGTAPKVQRSPLMPDGTGSGTSIGGIQIVTTGSTGQGSMTVKVFGSGFGVNPPIVGGGCGAGGQTSPDLHIQDTETNGFVWNVAAGSCVTMLISTWSDSYLVIEQGANYGGIDGAGQQYWFHPGDSVSVTVVNPQTGNQSTATVTVGSPDATGIPSVQMGDANRTCNCGGTNAAHTDPFNTRTGNYSRADKEIER